MKHEQLTWCRNHKHEVDYDLTHFCQIIPEGGCAACSFSCTLSIMMTERLIVFQIDKDNVIKHPFNLTNHPFLDEIRECINQPLVRRETTT